MAVENDKEQLSKRERQEAQEEAGFSAAFSEDAPTDEVAVDELEEEQQAEAGDEGNEAEDAEDLEADADDGEGDQNEEATPTEEQQAEEDRAHLETLLDSIPKLDENATLTATQIRQLQGKIGEINRVVQDLKSNPAGSSEPVKIDKAAFKKLGEEFPEIAEMLAEDLAGISLPSSGSQSVDYQPMVDDAVGKARVEMQQQMEVRLLSMQHRDWREVVKSDGFKNWVGSLPQTDQDRLSESWEAEFIGDKLSAYKELTQQKDVKRNERNKRLTRGIMPRGSNRPPAKGLTTEEDGFNAAFP